MTMLTAKVMICDSCGSEQVVKPDKTTLGFPKGFYINKFCVKDDEGIKRFDKRFACSPGCYQNLMVNFFDHISFKEE